MPSLLAELPLSLLRSQHEKISKFVIRTPLIRNDFLSEKFGVSLYFKLECLQKTGSFKPRGAFNALLRGIDTGAISTSAGVVTHSSGNHGAALAFAANKLGFPCTVVVPENTPRAKLQNIERYNGIISECAPTPPARQQACDDLVAQRGMTYISSFNHINTVCGQSGIGLEIFDELPDVDAVLVSISGGGLSSGIAAALKQLNPNVQVILVEPKSKGLSRSLKDGQIGWDPDSFVDTICNALRMQPCDVTWPLLKELISPDNCISVEDAAVRAWMPIVWSHLKVTAEPSAVICVAALETEQFRALREKHGFRKVAVVVCGGNVDIDKALFQ